MLDWIDKLWLFQTRINRFDGSITQSMRRITVCPYTLVSCFMTFNCRHHIAFISYLRAHAKKCHVTNYLFFLVVISKAISTRTYCTEYSCNACYCYAISISTTRQSITIMQQCAKCEVMGRHVVTRTEKLSKFFVIIVRNSNQLHLGWSDWKM